MRDKIDSYLGFAKKSRGLISGYNTCIHGINHGKMKLHELAKELNLNSKELVEKIHNMGIEAESHMSVLSDIEATAVKKTVLRSKGATETKIVKVAPKKVESGQDFEG